MLYEDLIGWLNKLTLDYANVLLIDLRSANLKGASLKGVNCTDSAFENCNLRRANFQGAVLCDGSGFANADFRDSNVKYAKYLPKELAGANLSGLDLSGINLVDSDCRDTNFSNSDLTGADLRGSNFSGANFSHTCLDKAHLDSSGDEGMKFHELTEIEEDLEGDKTNNTKLKGIILKAASFREAILTGIELTNADCKGLNFTGAILRKADLSRSNFKGANFKDADLRKVNLNFANLEDVNLENADLREAFLVGSNLKAAKISSAKVFGISAWDINLLDSEQNNLIITRESQPIISVDNLEIAQFIYLIMDNARIRGVIDSITTKVVLILGRFTNERKIILRAIRDRCRKFGFVPILFDFEKPMSRDITETITTLARLARFVIADITDAKSVPQELHAIVPNLPSVPVMPLLLKGAGEYSMFEHYKRYSWVLPVFRYRDKSNVIRGFKSQVLDPVEKYLREYALNNRIKTIRTKTS